MTAATYPSRSGADLSAASTPQAVPFVRLLRVETRKLFDTRIGQVLTAVLVVLSLGAMGGRAFVDEPDLQATIMISGAVLSTLLPVLGILSVTSEWSHHTALTTFALEPRRWRVVAAKCVPPLLAALVSSAVIVASAYAVVTVVSSLTGEAPTWTLEPTVLLGWFAMNVIFVLSGVAIGTLLLNAPAAIVVILLRPMVAGLVAMSGETGAAIVNWLDLDRTATPLLEGIAITGTETMRLAVSVAVWVVVPFALGALRVLRREVR